MLTHQNGLFKTSPKNVQPRIRQNGFPNFWTIRLRQTILLHLTKIVKTDYPKHPPKTSNQEFGKTAFQDFRPSFGKK